MTLNKNLLKRYPKLLQAASKDINIQKAIQLAYSAHKNQKRMDGEEYYHHVFRVAEDCCRYDNDTIVLALLHDVVEDTDITVERIEDSGINIANTKEDLILLSKDEQTMYDTFVINIFNSFRFKAIWVKRSDLKDNINSLHKLMALYPRNKKKYESRLIKYNLSLFILDLSSEINDARQCRSLD